MPTAADACMQGTVCDDPRVPPTEHDKNARRRPLVEPRNAAGVPRLTQAIEWLAVWGIANWAVVGAVSVGSFILGWVAENFFFLSLGLGVAILFSAALGLVRPSRCAEVLRRGEG